MPRITTYNIDIEKVKRASTPIISEIAKLLAISPEHITIQVNHDPFIFNGKVIQSHPFIELSLFDRPEELVDKSAQIITKNFLEQGCSSIDLYVTKLEKRRYFENGEHF